MLREQAELTQSNGNSAEWSTSAVVDDKRSRQTSSDCSHSADDTATHFRHNRLQSRRHESTRRQPVWSRLFDVR